MKESRRTVDSIAITSIKVLALATVVILLLIVGYVAFRALVSTRQVYSETVPSMSSNVQPFEAVVHSKTRLTSLSYPVLKQLYGRNIFSLRKLTGVDADVTLYIERGLEDSVASYLELDESSLSKSGHIVADREELLDAMKHIKGSIALVKPTAKPLAERSLKQVRIEDMVLAVHQSVTALQQNVKLSSVDEHFIQSVLDGTYRSWDEVGGHRQPIVVMPEAALVSQTPGAVALVPYQEAEQYALGKLQVASKVVSGNLSLSYLVEKPVESGRYGGVSTIILNTLMMVALTIAIAAPLGVASAIFLAEYKVNARALQIIRTGIDLLASVPSILFGLFGLLVFVQLAGWSFSLLSGSMTVAIMILPTIIRTSEESLRAVHKGLREASVAMGATKWETIWKVVVPAASPGILAGIILAIGRAIGETAVLMYTIGSSTETATSILSSARVLSMHIYLTITEGQSLDKAFASALVLLVLVLFINMIARAIIRRVFSHGTH